MGKLGKSRLTQLTHSCVQGHSSADATVRLPRAEIPPCETFCCRSDPL